MQSDLDILCNGARKQIAVPAMPLAAIRAGARRSAPSVRKRWTRAVSAALAGASIVAAAAGAAVLSGTHVSFDRSGLFEVRAQKMTSLRNPTLANLRSFASHADFPVVLPAGLPAGTTIASAHMFGSSALMVQYDLPGAWRRSDHLLTLVMANPDTVGGSPQTLPRSYEVRVGRKGPGAVQWAIGHETVLVMSSTATPAELARVKSAMIARSGQR